MHNFRKLNVWRKSNAFAVEIYNLTNKFSKKECFNLVYQLNRAIVSISSNIAEGCSRTTVKEIQRFLNIALGSSFEIESQLQIAFRLNYMSTEEYKDVLKQHNEIQKMIQGF